MTPPVAAARPDASILDASVVIVSFNTREVLRECLQTLARESEGLSIETFVVDNVSVDGSAKMVERDFPWVQLRRRAANLGFAGADNVAFREARGRYVALLNSDAFLEPRALRLPIGKMDLTPRCGLAGARLVGRDGAWQPSVRMFPSLLNDFLMLSALSARYRTSRFGAQLTLWRVRSAMPYYRKHHGALAWAVYRLERDWNVLRAWKNAGKHDAASERKHEDSQLIVEVMDQAWRETGGGRVSPPRP